MSLNEIHFVSPGVIANATGTLTLTKLLFKEVNKLKNRSHEALIFMPKNRQKGILNER